MKIAKKNHANLALVVGFILLFCGCMSNQKVLNQWVGGNANELILWWGEPDNKKVEGILEVWEYTRFGNKFPGTTGTKSKSQPEGIESKDYDNISGVRFFLNSRRTIVKYELIPI
jgi:hypothetical protein